jgi:exopolysaccharide production protein ExoY
VNDRHRRRNGSQNCTILLWANSYLGRALNRCVGRDHQIAYGSVNDYAGKLDSTGARGGTHAQGALGGVRKRALDIVIAGIVLITLAPILLVTGGLIRLLIGKSVIVIIQWVGFGGRVINCYQFRTHAGGSDDGNSEPVWRDHHCSVASLGSALKTSGLHKLPLLLNVLRGDMSLIGPRPIVRGEFWRYCEQMPEYFTARPGLTGLWRRPRSLCLTGLTSQMALDRYYLRNWSIELDFSLLIGTIFRSS